MYTEKDFKVDLVNKEQVKHFIEEHGRFACVCYDTDTKYAEKVGLECLKSGHFSGSRHLYFIFDLKMIPRFTIDQLVRHEQGVVKNVQSLRYCNKDGKINLYMAPEFKNNIEARNKLVEYENYFSIIYELLQKSFKTPLLSDDRTIDSKERLNEVTRTIMPIGIASECSFACNLEALIHLANVRLCNRAELPIRHLVQVMVQEVVKVEPRYSKYLVPKCVASGFCNESKSCGMYERME